MVNVARMVAESDLVARFEDGEDLRLVAQDARRYLLHYRWCGSVERLYFERGFKSCAVFFALITPIGDADEQLWVITGDVPPLYMEADAFPNGAQALRGYANLWLAWCEAAKKGEPLDDFPEVVASLDFSPLPVTPDLVVMVERRMKFIKEKLIKTWPEDLI